MSARIGNMVVAVAVVVAACSTGSSAASDTTATTQSVAAAVPSTTQATTPDTTAPTQSVTAAVTSTTQAIVEFQQVEADVALAAGNAYFTAVNTGDTEAVFALLAADATFSDNFTGSIPRDQWEQRLAWNVAQGTTLASPECTITPTTQDETTAVVCRSATHNAQIQAVGAPAVPTTVDLRVTVNGIAHVGESFGSPDFFDSVAPFEDWMRVHHPDALAEMGFGNWSSVDEATQNGALTAHYSGLWAEYLTANACGYRDGC